MESLVAYGSDSGDHDTDESSDEFCSYASETGDTQNSSLQSENIESESQNYFGISSKTHGQSDSNSEEEEGSNSREVISHLGNKVEIPQSDFWRDLSVDEIDVKSCASGSEVGRKRMFDSKGVQKDSYEHKRKKPTYDDSRPGGRSGSKNSREFAQTATLSATLSEHSSKIQNVKVYTVHPTISPYLGHHQASHCPSKLLRRWGAHFSVLNRLSWCSSLPYSHLLASVGADSVVRVWNAWGQHEPCVRTFTHHSKAVRDVQWSKDGRRILTCSYDRTAIITDVETGN
jgi:WD40 repeat protein